MNTKLVTFFAVLLLTGCIQLTDPAPNRPTHQTSALRSKDLADPPPHTAAQAHLRLRIDVVPRRVVAGPPAVIEITTSLTNLDDQQTVLTNACVNLDVRAIHGSALFFSNCVPTTISLGPGETLGQLIELPKSAFSVGTYQLRASLEGYDLASPPQILQVVRRHDPAPGRNGSAD